MTGLLTPARRRLSFAPHSAADTVHAIVSPNPRDEYSYTEFGPSSHESKLGGGSLSHARVRPVTLSIMRLGEELSMALTDSRGLARIGTKLATERELRRLATTLFDAAAAPGPDSLTRAGVDLAGLFPKTVRSYLAESPPRLLNLQLAEELLGIPWEQSFVGSVFLGEKFGIARQILAGSEFPEVRRPEVRGRVPRVLALVEAGDADCAPPLCEYRAALDAIGGMSVTWLDVRTASAADVHRSLPAFDILHCIASLDAAEAAQGNGVATALRELTASGVMPALLVVELACPFDDRRIGQFVEALPLWCQRNGCNYVAQFTADRSRPDFAPSLYSELVAGQPIAFALANARRSVRGGLSVFYGDGAQAPFPEADRLKTPDSRRQVTSMSYDLVNSTQLASTLGDERYSELLAGYHRQIAGIVVRHGGIAEDARGDDGVMCYFGLPVATERSTEQSILAALEIRNAVRALGVETRIGVSTGDVAVHDDLPYGPPVHLAARLQAIATPGDVVVSGETWSLVKDRFDFEELETRSDLKGIGKPVTIYRVLRERSAGSPERSGSGSSLTDFVGRAHELRLLREYWSASVRGGVKVVCVSGEAGIGKSRLLREFRNQLAGEGANIIECRCAQDHTASAFHPIIDFLHRSLQLSDRDEPDAKLDKIVAGFKVARQAEDAPALIARLLSVPFEARFGPLLHTPERLRERTLEVLLAWVRARTRKSPTCLFVEDANWSDPSSAELLRRLIVAAKRLPLLAILTLRSEATLGWEPPSNSESIELRGLDPESARALVVAASRGSQLPKDIVRALAERGDGVPLFIEESTRMTVEMGSASLSSLDALRRAVPSTIQDLLTARLDRLGSARQIAQIGGTIGREFPLTLLAAVVEHERAALPAGLMEHLQVLTASGMLVAKGGTQIQSYYFKHALVRDAAYHSLWERDRLRLHRAIAEVVAAKFPELAESQPELLAYHFTEAHHDREALACWERAARHAASRSANYEAIDHVKRGLAVLTRLPEGSERDRAELRLLLLLASRLIASEGYGATQVENVYRRALTLCDALDDAPALIKVQLGLEGYYFMRGDFARAREYASQAAALAARGSDPVPQLQARWAVANIVMHQGDFVAAVEQMDACLKTYEELTHRPSAVQDPGVMCLCYSAWGLWEMGFPDQALERVRRAVDLANSLRHSFSMGVAYGFRSTVHHFRGEFEDARLWAERAIEVCEDAGFVVWLAHAKVMHGRIVAELGEPARGVEEMRIGYDMWADTGAVVTQPFYLAMQSEGLAVAGDFDGALAVIDHAVQLVAEHGERYYEAEIRRLHGEFLLRAVARATTVSRAEAERSLMRALETAQAQRLGSLELRVALNLAQLAMKSGAHGRARQTLETALGKVHGGEATLDVRRARRLLDELHVDGAVGRRLSQA